MIEANHKQPRVLHSAALLRPPSGILNQMQWEQEAAQVLGIPWTTIMYCPNNAVSPNKITHFDPNISSQSASSPFKKLRQWIQLRRNYHQWLRTQVDNYDIFLLRYYVHDPYQWWFTKKFPKPIYFVHHTLEVPELAMPKTIGAFVRSTLEAWIGRYTLSYASGLIAVTDEILKYEVQRSTVSTKKSLIYPNGILTSNTSIKERRTEDIPEMLFVANFAPWHGLDLLIEYIKNTEEQFILHLVGKISDENLTALAQEDSRIILHGQMSHDEVLKLSEQCWIGLSSFALHRKEMTQACPLKVREYLMAGLPVYGESDIFPDTEFFYHHGILDLQKILAYAKQSRAIPKKKIQAKAMSYIDKKKLLQNLYKWIVKNEDCR